uniref:SPATA31 domain-containing protein n=1 Tax=Gopherus evgoodei TaxID=1825980 RepID=A0A8C4VD04_9SAUR
MGHQLGYLHQDHVPSGFLVLGQRTSQIHGPGTMLWLGSRPWDFTMARFIALAVFERGTDVVLAECFLGPWALTSSARLVHRPDWVQFLAKSPGGTRMSEREAKRQRDRESTAPRATGEAPMSLAGRSPAQVSPGALHVPGRLELAEAETPFLQSDVRASLERHVQVKRLQHTLGLPCTLQSALKIFMPPAPKPIARRPSGADRVVTMPQALPFLSVGSRTELERHLQRMVHLKRWGLPRRIQESLRLLMPATPPHPRLGPLPSGRWAPRGPGPVMRAAQTPSFRARAPAQASQGAARASKSAPGSHCCRDTWELQGHIARKGLEIRLGALPAMLRSSQKMAALGCRDLLLPKLIPPGCKAPLAHHRLCPLLSHKHEWGLPGLVQRSLSCFMPSPPTRPRPKGSDRPAAMELRVSSESPPIPLATKRELEAHIRQRVAERRWGLPRRVQESLRGFMPPTTAAPGTHPDTQGRRASQLLSGLSARRAPRESPSRAAPVGPTAVAVSLAG